ncbi:hypothetical protein SAMN04490240_2836 [Rhodococcus pyridinivorans]|nr:hypothetical protein SAMN04490240_2836 [Rhodococcus pyridinivorans]
MPSSSGAVEEPQSRPGNPTCRMGGVVAAHSGEPVIGGEGYDQGRVKQS